MNEADLNSIIKYVPAAGAAFCTGAVAVLGMYAHQSEEWLRKYFCNERIVWAMLLTWSPLHALLLGSFFLTAYGLFVPDGGDKIVGFVEFLYSEENHIKGYSLILLCLLGLLAISIIQNLSLRSHVYNRRLQIASIKNYLGKWALIYALVTLLFGGISGALSTLDSDHIVKISNIVNQHKSEIPDSQMSDSKTKNVADEYSVTYLVLYVLFAVLFPVFLNVAFRRSIAEIKKSYIRLFFSFLMLIVLTLISILLFGAGYKYLGGVVFVVSWVGFIIIWLRCLFSAIFSKKDIE